MSLWLQGGFAKLHRDLSAHSLCDQWPEHGRDACPCLSLPILDPLSIQERSAPARIGVSRELPPGVQQDHQMPLDCLPMPNVALGIRWERDLRALLRSQNPFFPLSIHLDFFSSTKTPSDRCCAMPCECPVCGLKHLQKSMNQPLSSRSRVVLSRSIASQVPQLPLLLKDPEGLRRSPGKWDLYLSPI